MDHRLTDYGPQTVILSAGKASPYPQLLIPFLSPLPYFHPEMGYFCRLDKQISSVAKPSKWVGRYLKKAKDFTSPFLERQVASSDQWYATSSGLYADEVASLPTTKLLPAVILSNGGQARYLCR